MDRDRLIAVLREKMAAGHSGDPFHGASADGVKDGGAIGRPAAGLHAADRGGAISRLTAALSVPASFAELERELPPAARYLGPVAWMDAIREETGR